MNLHPNRRVVALAAAAIVGLTVGASQSARLDDADAQVLGTKIDKKAPIVDASCDIDGVAVGYTASYAATPAPAGYRVGTVTVRDVAATCVDAEVSVQLLEGDVALGSAGTTTAAGATVEVTMPEPPPAARVTRVQVVIAGGTTPVPSECEAITFDQFLSLTNGADNHAGGKGNDLIYGLDGHDTIRGGNKDDCLVGQDGNDTLHGDSQADVLLGGDGDDVLDGGNQDDVLVGGPGDDVLHGGAGRDTCHGGPGTTTYVGCEVQS